MPAIRWRLAAAPAAILALGLGACAPHFAQVDPSANWSQGNYDAGATAQPAGVPAQSADPARKKKPLAAP